MSLIRVRHSRRDAGSGKARPPRTGRLILILILVAGAIWYLGKFT